MTKNDMEGNIAMLLLENIHSPSDLKRLSPGQLPALAQEIREFLIQTVTATGGHLASNLGVVELTIAMLYVYDFPMDKLIFDVGHQSYVYKILTGRREQFNTLRKSNGLAGFPLTDESRFDCFDTGHSSTAISAALGMARARELFQGNYLVAALVGDGSLTGGMSWEALSDVGASKTPMMIVLNDNEMSIDKNVGGISQYLSKIRLGKGYASFKRRVRKIVSVIPPVYRFMRRFRNDMKFRILKNKIFEQVGIKYIGPVDGHNIAALIDYFTLLKDYPHPVLLHVLTKKGKGCEEAELDPSIYHGVEPDSEQCAEAWSFSKTLGNTLCDLASEYSDVVAVVAAMKSGTGLSEFAAKFRERFFDVGIAESHAVTMAAGMAASGAKAYVAIYSTFLQRSYDQILHDVCLQDLPVVFCLDRAGVSNGDGKTHHGIYDFGYLSAMPNMTVAAPKTPADFEKLLHFAHRFPHPLSIRYPKCCAILQHTKLPKIPDEIYPAKWTEIREMNADYNVVAIGDRALKIALDTEGKHGIWYADFLVADSEVLQKLFGTKKLVVLEDAVSSCGLFSKVSQYYATLNATHSTSHAPQLIPMGFDNVIIPHGKSDDLLEANGISVNALSKIFAE